MTVERLALPDRVHEAESGLFESAPSVCVRVERAGVAGAARARMAPLVRGPGASEDLPQLGDVGRHEPLHVAAALVEAFRLVPAAAHDSTVGAEGAGSVSLFRSFVISCMRWLISRMRRVLLDWMTRSVARAAAWSSVALVPKSVAAARRVSTGCQ